MPAKGDQELLRNVIGSTGQKNEAIKNFFRKVFQRRTASGPKT